MAQGKLLYPGRVDVMAAADNHILDASFQVQITLCIKAAQVAGHKPAVRVERACGGSFITVIAQHQAGPAPADLTHLTGLHGNVRVLQ